MLRALGAVVGVAGFAVPWKLAASVGERGTNTLLLLLTAAGLNALLSLVQARRTGRALPRPSGFELRLASLLALLTLVGNLASAEAIRSLSSAQLNVVLRAEVVIAALIAWPLLGERVEPRFWIGAAIAGAGFALQQSPGAWSGFEGTGLAWALGATLLFSAMAVITRRHIHGIDPVAVNGLRLWISVGLWFGLHGWPDSLSRITALQASYAAVAALFGPFAGRLCMMLASRDLEIRFVTLFLLISPVLTLALAFVVLDEWPETRALWGGAVMLFGIAIPLLGALGRTKDRGAEQGDD